MQGWSYRVLVTAAGAALAAGMGGMAAGQTQGPSDSGAGQGQRTLQMVRAKASLDTTLDAKKAKQGEPVKAKLEEKVQIPNEQALPRNTVLEGQVDQVQPSEHKGDSTIVVTFDKAKLKNGQEVPIKATVLRVSEPALMQEQAAGGGAPGGGGGSMAGASPAPTAPAPLNVPEPGTNAPPPPEGGVPGVMLTSDIHRNTSATFTSKGRNVHVPGGTEMQMALAVIPAGVKVQ
jgi:hypothetical protein